MENQTKFDYESKEDRLNNCYRIIDRNSNSIRFKLNPVQQNVLRGLHTRNLILKARQLGMSTFAVLYLLDEVLNNFNMSAGIVSYSLEHAQHIFKKIIGHAIERFPYKIVTKQQSAREVSFQNGSSLRVDTTLRGGAYQLVLVSEFGKTCARSPQKAEEVIAGTLNTISQSGTAIIESTGEGNTGYFAEMVNHAAQRGNENLSTLEYRLFFYPWMKEPSYRMKTGASVDTELTDYFNKIASENGEPIDKEQRIWYATQRQILGDKIRQEFPSTIAEAFLTNSDAYYFAELVEKARTDNRCLHTSLYDALAPVYVSMDIGVNDLTVIIFFQVVHGEIRIIDFYADKNKGCDFYARYLLQDKKYLYHTIFLPHDSKKRSQLQVENTYEKDLRRLFAGAATRFIVLKPMDKQLQISHAKVKLERCVFNASKVNPLLDNLCRYRKKWSEQYGRYMDEPYHDESSNYADAFMYAMQGVTHIEAATGIGAAQQKHRQVV